MSSTFGRLFAYARSAAVEAKENFTTEALAAAIRHDPAPFLRVLASHGVLLGSRLPLETSVQTQVPISGAGIIDLLVLLRTESSTNEVWVEVKVDASESGMQITNYLNTIARSTLENAPHLIVLSKRPLDGHPDVPWISWQAVRREASTSEAPYWEELAGFLKEINMADDYDNPITDAEANSLLASHSLFRKSQRIIGSVIESARPRWPQLAWPNAVNDVEEQLLWQFKRSRRLTIPIGTATPIRIFLGVAQDDDSADFHHPEPHMTVWLENSPKQTDLRRGLLEQATQGHLADGWTPRIQGWWALTASEPASSFKSNERAADWILERITDLDRAGIIAYVTHSQQSNIGGGDTEPSVEESP